MANETLINLINRIHSLDDSQLASSLKIYLKEGTFAEVPITTNRERHLFLAELFNECNTLLQERLRRVFAEVLEHFEGTNRQDDAEYLFYLVSLASVIRSSQTKERLRRWVRQGTFDTWSFEMFNLTTEILLASSSYDSDDIWIEFLTKVLPTRPSFRDNA